MSCLLLLGFGFYYRKKGSVSNILFLHPIAILPGLYHEIQTGTKLSHSEFS